MKRENYPHALTVAYLAQGLTQSFELAYNYVFFIVLSVEQIGFYSYILALVLFFNIAVNMGIEPVLVRKFGQGELRLMRAFQAILLMRVPVIILGTVVTTMLYSDGILSSEQYFVTILIGAQVIFNVLDGVFKSWLQANNRQNVVNITASLFSGLKLAFIAIMFAFAWNSLIFLVAGILILRGICSAFFGYLACTVPFEPAAHSPVNSSIAQVMKDLFRTGLSIGGINVFAMIQNRLDWLLVSGMISTVALASYSLANKLYEILQMIIGVALQTVYPWLCRDEEEKRKSLMILVRLVILAGAILGFCGFFAAPALLKLMFADKFAGIELPVRIMMFSASIIATSGVYYYIALSKGFEAKLLFISALTTALQFGSNLFLIPRLGISGAALGMLVLTITTLIGEIILVQARSLVPRFIIRRVLIFLTAFVFYIALLLGFNMTPWIGVSGGLILIVGTGWIALFNHSERKFMLAIIPGIVQKIVNRTRILSTEPIFDEVNHP